MKLGARARVALFATGTLAVTPAATSPLAHAFLFPGSRAAATTATTATTPAGFVERRLIAKDGTPVRVLELAAAPEAHASPRAPTFVVFHNNRESAEDQASLARALVARGGSVSVVEYRGYGRSREGSPSESGLYLDAEAALDALEGRGVGPERIVLYGASLGTGVAAEMARRGRGAALVLVTPYTSIPEIVAAKAPLLPLAALDALVPDRFDTLAKAKAIRVPTLIVHGDADEIVPFEMGDRLSKTIAGARIVRIASGRHGDLFARANDLIHREIAGLVARAFATPPHEARGAPGSR